MELKVGFHVPTQLRFMPRRRELPMAKQSSKSVVGKVGRRLLLHWDAADNARCTLSIPTLEVGPLPKGPYPSIRFSTSNKPPLNEIFGTSK